MTFQSNVLHEHTHTHTKLWLGRWISGWSTCNTSVHFHSTDFQLPLLIPSFAFPLSPSHDWCCLDYSNNLATHCLGPSPSSKSINQWQSWNSFFFFVVVVDCTFKKEKYLLSHLFIIVVLRLVSVCSTEFTVFLPWPAECWNYRHASPWLAPNYCSIQMSAYRGKYP